MSPLSILYWLLLILWFIGCFIPTSWPHYGRAHTGFGVILFVLIGLRSFPVQLH